MRAEAHQKSLKTIHTDGQGLFYKTKQVLIKLVSWKMLPAVTVSLGKTELVAVKN